MTKRKYARMVLVFMLLTMFAGMALMFSAGSIGLQSASALARTESGTVDIDVYNMLAGTIATSCQYAGRIVTSIGGLGVLGSCAAIFYTMPAESVKKIKTYYSEMG